MLNFSAPYEVTYKSQTAGRVLVSPRGLLTGFECTCTVHTGDVLRLVGVTPDTSVSLGILMPQGDLLTLNRSFSKNQIAPLLGEDRVSFFLIKADQDIRTLPQMLTAKAPAEALPEAAPALAPLPKPESDPAAAPASPPAAENTVPVMVPPASKPPVPDVWQQVPDPGRFFSDEELISICQSINDALYQETKDGILLAVPVFSDRPFPLMPVFCCGDSMVIDGKTYVVFTVKNGKLETPFE